METTANQKAKAALGAADAGRFFSYMAQYIGFTTADAEAVKESALIIEKYIPDIVAAFYAHVLRYPPTRKYFLRKDGTLDQEYVQLRMHHLTNFWRRASSGVYDDEFARYVDYVGRAHTSHGADPGIYIPERYVIGQVGFMQRAISEALEKELHAVDADWERRALRAWNLLMMVILEMLSRAYGEEREPEMYAERASIDHSAVHRLAVETYELGLSMRTAAEPKDVTVGYAADIPDGARKIVQVDGLSIGVFHHKGAWYALRNSCLHRGGPVASGRLEGDILTCPWHGFAYNVTNGQLLTDAAARLDMYPVEVRAGKIHLQIPVVTRDSIELTIGAEPEAPAGMRILSEGEFRTSDVAPGRMKHLRVDGQGVVVYNVNGSFFATQDECTHAGGPLEEGELEGNVLTCPVHGACFDVTTGQVLCEPAEQPLKTFRVTVDGEIARVEENA